MIQATSKGIKIYVQNFSSNVFCKGSHRFLSLQYWKKHLKLKQVHTSSFKAFSEDRAAPFFLVTTTPHFNPQCKGNRSESHKTE